MWDYSEKVMDHFLNPRNSGEIANPDAVGEVGSMTCGDALRLTLKIDKKERIADAKFQTFGCGSAIASSSILTEMIKGLTLEEASRITNKDIAGQLDGLPPEKMHCSVMGMEALEAAINNYRGRPVEHEELEGTIVCKCFGVTDEKIERVVRENNLSTVEDVTHFCKAGGGCEECHPQITEIIQKVQAEKGVAVDTGTERKPPKKLTNIQKMHLIMETIDREIRPGLNADGGDIELIDIDGDRVMVALRGSCAECVASSFTLKSGVEAKLKEFVSDAITVEEVEQ
jgi:NifU-like protein